MSYTPNSDGHSQLFNRLGDQIKAIDAEVRQQYAGRDVADIESALREHLQASTDASVPDEQLTAWATAIAEGRAFELH